MAKKITNPKAKAPKPPVKPAEQVPEQRTTKIFNEKDFMHNTAVLRIFANFKSMAYSSEYGEHEVKVPTSFSQALSRASDFIRYWSADDNKQDAIIMAINWRATGLVAEVGVKLIFQCSRFSIEPIFITTKYNDDVLGFLITKRGV